jgi:hypothetical protein
MTGLVYNKGKPCLYGPLLCQEGVCSGCLILLDQSTNCDLDLKEQNIGKYGKLYIKEPELVATRS